MSLSLARVSSFALVPALIGAFAPLACSQAPAPSGEKVVRAAEPIQGGTVDTKDTAVVAILIDTSQGMSLCSGTLVAPNLVLSAHHCVANVGSTACSSNSFGALYGATSFRVTTSYDAAALVFNSGNPALPAADGVTWWAVSSVAVPGNDICGQDLSALTLSSPITGVCPIIPSVDVSPTTNETYTAIGFGITSPNGQTAGTRYSVNAMVVQCTDGCGDPSMSTEEWQGGSTNSQGTCEGDSGGPAIDSLGRAMGSVSRGAAGACNQTVYEGYIGQASWIKQMATAAATAGSYAVAGWVTGGATSNPANGYCPGGGSGAAGADAGDDGSVAPDGGAAPDAGLPSDAGTADGSAPQDAGSDDGGAISPDAGSPSPDAGSAPDSGTLTPDAGVDASLEDAGSDSGGGASASQASDESSGCSVTAGSKMRDERAGGLGVAAIAAGVAFARRRRRR